MKMKKKKKATPKVKTVPIKHEFAILFLMEVLPSRAPLCFRLRGKDINFLTYCQVKCNKHQPAI